MKRNWIYIENPIFKTPHYRISKFNFCLKLNQRIQSASIYRSNTVDFSRYKKVGGKLKRYEEFIEAPFFISEPIQLFVNHQCYPPILAIRKWKIWLKSMNCWYFTNKICKTCDFYFI